MAAPESNPSESRSATTVAASAWLAAVDRGLTAAEQDAYSAWLAADPRHREEIARLRRAWTSLDSLAVWQPADGAAPNPDLLAPARRRSSAPAGRSAWFGLGVAAAVALVVFWPHRPAEVRENVTASPRMQVIPLPERQELSDGSLAEVNHQGVFHVAFRPEERRVQLREGEVYLSVAKDAARPFLVDVEGVVVRAVGTAFNVRRERDRVDVLVTEGTVQVEQPSMAPVRVTQGERARIPSGGTPVVTAATAETIARELAWRSVRLDFEAMPLQAVVAEFNLRNSRKLEIGDAAAGKVRVAGTFRADEPEAFVRILEAGFGIVAERPDTGTWVLFSAEAAKKK